MLAAVASKHDSALDSVKLALQIRAGTQTVPAPLADHLLETIRTSLLLLTNPAAQVAKSSPDAISLAVCLQDEPELQKAFTEVLNHPDNDDLAQNALDGLEAAFEAHYQPAYFIREIYATI